MKPGPIAPVFGFSKRPDSHLPSSDSSTGLDLRYRSIAAEILAEMREKPADEIVIKGAVPKHMRERGETSVVWTLTLKQGSVDHEVLSTFCMNTAVLVLAEISEQTGIAMRGNPGLKGWQVAYSIPDLAASIVDLTSHRGPDLSHALQEASSQHGKLRLMQKITQEQSKA